MRVSEAMEQMETAVAAERARIVGSIRTYGVPFSDSDYNVFIAHLDAALVAWKALKTKLSLDPRHAQMLVTKIEEARQFSALPVTNAQISAYFEEQRGTT